MATQDTHDDTDPADSPQAAALIAVLAAAFSLSAAAIRNLATIIYSARIQAYSQVYQAIAQTVGASLPADWVAPDVVLAAQSDAALAAAQSVAATLARDVTADATRLVNNWVATHAALPDPLAPLAETQYTLTLQLRIEVVQRGQWKAAQISLQETGLARANATQDAVHAVQDGTLTDPSGDTIDVSQYVIAVLPAGSSGDASCSEYAGNTYPLADDYILDLWPAHPQCIHYAQIMLASDV